jgi:hypothetical protein
MSYETNKQKCERLISEMDEVIAESKGQYSWAARCIFVLAKAIKAIVYMLYCRV